MTKSVKLTDRRVGNSGRPLSADSVDKIARSELAQELRDWRKRFKIRRDEAIKLLGVSVYAYTRWELGERCPHENLVRSFIIHWPNRAYIDQFYSEMNKLRPL